MHYRYTEDIDRRFIECLLAIPFPYSDILREQINASEYTTSNKSYHYRINFKVDANVQALPDWLDNMPLSWQVPTDDAPLLCQLFVKAGYIDILEIVDMGWSEIDWDRVWNTHPVLDYEYDKISIYTQISNTTVRITKVNTLGNRIDWSQELDGKMVTASFRGCLIQRLVLGDFPKQCSIKISEIVDHDFHFLVQSNDGDIDFKCAMIFLQRHRIIG